MLQCDARVGLAASVAERLDADLSAVFALPPPEIATWAGGLTLEALERELIELEAAAVRAEGQFTAVLRKHGLHGRWLLKRGPAEICVIRSSRALISSFSVSAIRKGPTHLMRPRTSSWLAAVPC